jgi:hypothetical protein
LNRYESMDSQNESTFLQFSYTIPATLKKIIITSVHMSEDLIRYFKQSQETFFLCLKYRIKVLRYMNGCYNNFFFQNILYKIY